MSRSLRPMQLLMSSLGRELCSEPEIYDTKMQSTVMNLSLSADCNVGVLSGWRVDAKFCVPRYCKTTWFLAGEIAVGYIEYNVAEALNVL